MANTKASSPGYRAIVDMGSNGIRCSITDTSRQVARNLPVVYQHRTGISLYDAQWEGGSAVAISADIIKAVTSALQSFQRTCYDFGVLPEHIRIVATEATRTAQNSDEFQAAIKDVTGLAVEMYPKAVEGLVGAYGVASSFEQVRGLVMDLGGGSTQITWLKFPDHEHPEKVSLSSEYSVSMPYGAAALLRRLREASQSGPAAVARLKKEITDNMKAAVHSINIPPQLLQEAETSGLSLYLSGGGFRGWGYVQMHQHHVQPYPIPLINGFRVTPSEFYNIESITRAVDEYVSSTSTDSSQIFRVSARRASQVPAVAFLVSCLIDALPTIKDVYFAQGGVREGTLFRDLSADVRALDPLAVATSTFASPAAHDLAALLHSSIPSPSTITTAIPCPLTSATIAAFTNTLYMHAALPPDIRASAGLRFTTTGALAGSHGLSHTRRALLALFLCESYGGMKELAAADQPFYTALARILPEGHAWWALYLGRVAAVLRAAWPAGVRVDSGSIQMRSIWEVTKDKKAKEGAVGKVKSATLKLSIEVIGEQGKNVWTEDVQSKLRGVEKAGKKKNWIGFERGCGVEVVVKEV